MSTSLLVGTALTPLTVLAPAAMLAPAEAAVGQGFNLNPSDLKFILRQIKISEQHAANFNAANPCAGLMGNGEFQIPTTAQGEELPWGLRTVDGTCNNLVPGQAKFGAADQTFPRSAGTDFRDADPAPPGFPGNATTPGGNTSYARVGSVVDSQPRTISNLIVDQTPGNPAAQAVAGPDATPDESGTLFIPNEAPDVGLSAPFNSWFTLFGQFFDHGLDLVNKGGAGTVFMPLDPSDPLFNPATPGQNFMVVTRASGSPGSTTNQTATFVDQSQTYTSHPSHQVFLREYDEDRGRQARQQRQDARGHPRRRHARRNGHLGLGQGAGPDTAGNRARRPGRPQPAAAGHGPVRQVPARRQRVPAADPSGQRQARGQPGRPGGRLAGRPDRTRLPRRHRPPRGPVRRPRQQPEHGPPGARPGPPDRCR